MNDRPDEWCIEMLRMLVREELDQGRISESEKQDLLLYLFKTTPVSEDSLSTLKTPTTRTPYSR